MRETGAYFVVAGHKQLIDDAYVKMGTNAKDFADAKDKFDDLSGTMFGDGIKSCGASPLEDALLVDPDSCRLCGWVPKNVMIFFT